MYYPARSNFIVIEAAEDDMREWIEQFLEEVGEIELFFNTKYEEFASEFHILKEMYIRKKETKKDDKKEKKFPDF